MPTLPSRDVLRAEFDAAVLELDRSRPGSNLTTDFYSRIGDSVFEAGYSALADTCGAEGKPKARLHVVSAPVGSGKTSFSLALVAAVTRLAVAGCSEMEIATLTGHSPRDVHAILDAHYLNRDPALPESAHSEARKRNKSSKLIS